MTAQALQEAQPNPQPLLITSALLREQHFGIAECKPWTYRKPGLSFEEHCSQALFPSPFSRTDRFRGGENLEEVANRAEQAVQEMLLPHVWQAAREGTTETHVAVITHGIYIGELIVALVQKGTKSGILQSWNDGLRNTAWTRVSVETMVSSSRP
jgi:broad specificity phosphatase PhoE